MQKHVVPMVKTALEQGIRAFDSAVLYRATLQLGKALEALGVDPNEIRFQTKCLRYLGMAALATNVAASVMKLSLGLMPASTPPIRSSGVPMPIR